MAKEKNRWEENVAEGKRTETKTYWVNHVYLSNFKATLTKILNF